MKYKLAHVMEYAAVRAVCGLLVALPHRAALALAWGPVRLALALNGKLRARTRRRLRQALGPAKSESELDRIAWLAFRNLAFTAVEGIRLPGIDGRRGWTGTWSWDALDEVHAELAQGHGFIVAVPHMGNWELAGIALHSQGVDLMTLARRQKNPLMDAWINRLRMSTGVEAIDTKTRDDRRRGPQAARREEGAGAAAGRAGEGRAAFRCAFWARTSRCPAARRIMRAKRACRSSRPKWCGRAGPGTAGARPGASSRTRPWARPRTGAGSCNT